MEGGHYQVDPLPNPMIGWFVRNHTAATLLVATIFLGGAVGIGLGERETYPRPVSDLIDVNIAYPGAMAQQIEDEVLIRMETAIDRVEGIDNIESEASFGAGRIVVAVRRPEDIEVVVGAVGRAVDGIAALPDGMEEPLVRIRATKQPVLSVHVGGAGNEIDLESIARELSRRIEELEVVRHTQLLGTRPSEMSVEIDQDVLLAYDLTLAAVARAIDQWSVNVTAGVLNDPSDDIVVSTNMLTDSALLLGGVVVAASPDGSLIRLREIAEITDEFAEQPSVAYLNGVRSFGISVYGDNGAHPSEVSDVVRQFVDSQKDLLGTSVTLAVASDNSVFLKGRLEMLLKNMVFGGLLATGLLGAFLGLRAAGLVILGIVVSFLGAFMIMPFVDVTLNPISLFGFIMALGLIVDDSIIVAESITKEASSTDDWEHAVVIGTQRVFKPTVFGMITTIAAFTPLLFVVGTNASVAWAIGWVVILCLTFSIVESKFLLPSHLAAASRNRSLSSMQSWVNQRFQALVDRHYRRLLEVAMKYRWTTIAAFLTSGMLAYSLVESGLVRTVWYPEVDGDYVYVMGDVVGDWRAENITSAMEDIYGGLNTVVARLRGRGLDDPVQSFHFGSPDRHSAVGHIELMASDRRTVSSGEIERMWRDAVGDVEGLRNLTFSTTDPTGLGPPVSFRLRGNNSQDVLLAAKTMQQKLRSTRGVHEVLLDQGSERHLALRVGDRAVTLGFTPRALAEQVRHHIYGIEAQRIQRGQVETIVMVRLRESERSSVAALDDMWLMNMRGHDVPMSDVLEQTEQEGVRKVTRYDRQRVAVVSAAVDLSEVDPEDLAADLIRDVSSEFPSVVVHRHGASEDSRNEMTDILVKLGAALLAVFVLVASALKSYRQALVVLLAVPFGLVGAVVGHAIVDIPMSSISFIGFVALAGIVVNDGLVLMDHANREFAAGANRFDAFVSAGTARFRPVFLTSATTFLGLLPIVGEQSMQAQVVVPMAVSVAFGIIFSTMVILVLVPSILCGRSLGR